jgi:hypothetical protein
MKVLFPLNPPDDLAIVNFELADMRACIPRDQIAQPMRVGRSEPMPVRSIEASPGSAAHRWAVHVMKACEADGDLKTLKDWARCAGVSYSTLCESCRIIGIRPRTARDFARVLRAVIKSSVYGCDPSVLLDISDRRTLRVLLRRVGQSFAPETTMPVAQFIKDQGFVSTSNEGIRVLLGYLEQRQCEEPAPSLYPVRR